MPSERLNVIVAVGDAGAGTYAKQVITELNAEGHNVLTLADAHGLGKDALEPGSYVLCHNDEDVERAIAESGITEGVVFTVSSVTARNITNTVILFGTYSDDFIVVVGQDAAGSATHERMASGHVLVVNTNEDYTAAAKTGEYREDLIFVCGDPRRDRMILGTERLALRNHIRKMLQLTDSDPFIPVFLPGLPPEATIITLEWLMPAVYPGTVGGRLHPKLKQEDRTSYNQALLYLVSEEAIICSDELMEALVPGLPRELWGDALSAAGDLTITVWSSEGERAVQAGDMTMFVMIPDEAIKDRTDRGMEFPFQPYVANGCAIGVYRDALLRKALEAKQIRDTTHLYDHNHLREAIDDALGNDELRKALKARQRELPKPGGSAKRIVEVLKRVAPIS